MQHTHQTKLRIYPGFWDVDTVERRTECLFVYGDNDVHKGLGGQAIIRNLPNAIGIPTKKFPNNNLTSYYNDTELISNMAKIDHAIQQIINESINYKYVVLPKDGLGTGLAKLPIKAPHTYAYLCQKLSELKNII